MIMSTPALAVAFAGMLPLMLYTMWSDLKRMIIPNAVCLAVFGIFLATGSWGLDLPTFGWRILHAVIAFGVGFLVFQVSGGNIGGGDIKLIVAFVPFIPGAGATTVIFLFSVIALATIALFLAARWVLRGRDVGYAAFNQKMYLPAGISLGVTVLIYMGLELARALGIA